MDRDIKQENKTSLQYENRTGEDTNSWEELKKSKCGEILQTENDFFVIVCIWCHCFYSEYNEFLKHMKENHKNMIMERLTDKSFLEDNSYIKQEPIEEHKHISIEETVFTNVNSNVNVNPNVANVSQTPIKRKQNRTFSCKACDNVFKTKKSLMQHCELMHNKTNQDGEIKPIRQKKRYSCELCTSTWFRYQRDLKNHQEIVHGYLKPYALKKYNSDEDDKNEEKIDPLQCTFCQRICPSRCARIEHERVHSDEKPFSCKKCNKSFKSEKTLKLHQYVHIDYENHPYKCEECRKTFTSKYDLRAHIRWHNNEKNYKCRYCDKTFVYATRRAQHERIHNAKNFLCSLCGQRFISKYLLSMHVKLHSGIKTYKCEYCERFLRTKSKLTEHVRTHTGEKPYECKTCSARFATSTSLRMHTRLHADTAEYKCNICGKCFKQNAGLYMHKKSHKIT